MVNGSQLINEALDILRSFRDIVENKVLSKSATLKPQVVSVAQKLIDVSITLSKLFETVSKHVSETNARSIIIPSPWWSISVYGDRIVITRHKPKVASIAYVKSDEKIIFITKYLKLELQRGFIIMKKRGLKLELDPGDPGDIVTRIADIKYVLRDIAGDLELLNYIAEKKLSK